MIASITYTRFYRIKIENCPLEMTKEEIHSCNKYFLSISFVPGTHRCGKYSRDDIQSLLTSSWERQAVNQQESKLHSYKCHVRSWVRRYEREWLGRPVKRWHWNLYLIDKKSESLNPGTGAPGPGNSQWEGPCWGGSLLSKDREMLCVAVAWGWGGLWGAWGGCKSWPWALNARLCSRILLLVVKSETETRKRGDCWDFPGGPVVKTLPFNAGGLGSIPGWGTRSHMPQSQKTKT